MVVTKLDVLDELDEIPVCVAYSIDGKVTLDMPATVRELAKAEPIYETLPGWKSSTVGISNWDKLPAAARRYVEFLEKKTGVEAGCISTGPERMQTIVRDGIEVCENYGVKFKPVRQAASGLFHTGSSMTQVRWRFLHTQPPRLLMD